VFAVCFSPDGGLIASGAGDAAVRIWDARGTARPLRLEGHARPMSSVCFAAGGERLVTRSWDRTTRVWDAHGGHCLEVSEGEGGVDAAPAAETPWRVVERDLETVVEEAATGGPVARLPLELWDVNAAPAGRTWAGAAGNYLCLFTLEGTPPGPSGVI
jgi:WD40 repeat protein